MNTPIPTLRFDTNDLPESERFDIWRSGVHAHRVWLPEGADPARFSAQVVAWTLGEVVMAQSRLSAICLARTPEMARADGEDWISLAFQLSGTTVFTLDNGDFVRTAGPGEIIAFDTTRDFKAEASAHEVVTCQISRRAIRQVMQELPSHHGQVIDGAWGRLLADCMLSLIRQFPDMAASDAPGLSQTLVQLVAACLKAKSDTQARRMNKQTAGIRHRAEVYLKRNLTSPDLNPVSICEALGISKASLYRAFAGSEGVMSYVRKRRLEAIHVLLNDPRETRGIGAIAYQYGFVSEAHFSRVFRQKFGFSPRDVRVGLLAAFENDENDDETAILSRWVKHLS